MTATLSTETGERWQFNYCFLGKKSLSWKWALKCLLIVVVIIKVVAGKEVWALCKLISTFILYIGKVC